jgi:hypothetical protein
MSKRPMILLEFNELCPSLLDKWMGEGRLPNFRRFYDASDVFVSEADAEPPALEPWIQWYSMHSGLPYAEHKVFNLTDGPKVDFPDIWGLLRKAGYKTFNCGSMNAKNDDDPKSIFLPDPWCTTERASPDQLNVYYDFVRSQVQEYTNPDRESGLKRAARFVTFMATHGLSLGTVSAIISQVAKEKTSSLKIGWKRATILDRLQTDLFLHSFETYRPDFATFFLNSTAHYQHTYWRYMDPAAFVDQPSDEDLDTYKDAILYGYECMDKVLARFIALAEKKNLTLVLASALSQQPFLEDEGEGGRRYYRPKNMDKLLKTFGIEATKVQPVMTHQYSMQFEDDARMKPAVEILESVTYKGERAFEVRTDGDRLYFGCLIYRRAKPGAQLDYVENGQSKSVALDDLFYLMDIVKSGRHHPDGILWFRTGAGKVHEERVSVLDVLPTVLDYFDAPRPMTGENRPLGRCVIDAWKKGPDPVVEDEAPRLASTG